MDRGQVEGSGVSCRDSLSSDGSQGVRGMSIEGRHFDCIPILISFIKDEAYSGNLKAAKCLRDWDKARRIDMPCKGKRKRPPRRK